MKTGDFCCWPDSAVRLAQEYDRFLGYSGHTATAAAWPSLTHLRHRPTSDVAVEAGLSVSLR
jgi:hypothetical protein